MLNRATTFKLILSLVFSCASVPVTAQVLRLERTAIIDGVGFGQPMIAATLFKPFGWKEKGGIVWDSMHACTRGWAVNWSAESADGTRSIGILPQHGWEQSSEGRPMNFDCPLLALNSAEDYLRVLVQQMIPGAKIQSYRTRPDIAQAQAAGHSSAGLVNNGFTRQTREVDAGELVFDFEKDGHTLRASFSTAVVAIVTLTGGEGYGIGPPIRTVSYEAEPMFVFYAPVGSFKSASYEAMRRSIMLDENWVQKIAGHHSNMNRIDRKGAYDRSRISHEANARIAEMNYKAWQSNQRSSDARAGDFINAIREVQSYSDQIAPGGQVELSSQYDKAWRLQDGSYVLTDDPSFQPQQALGMDGQLLAPTR